MAGLSRRRFFFFGPVLAGAVPVAGFGSTASLTQLGYKSPNEKLNIAAVGSGGKGTSDISGCAQTENIVALCDVDEVRAERTFKRYENVPKFKDYRRMLDEMGKSIDAVTVSTPDHMHATVAMFAMERGKHVYVQKPMARTVWEARVLTQAARKYGVATQMGNQGYCGEGSRICSEMIWSGAIGNVTEVHAWTNRPIWPQGLTEKPAEQPVPATMAWDLWLGIAKDRPYSPAYAPHNWRGFFDFGCGALGDMACHILGAPNMALRLGAPSSVECVSIEGRSSFTFPKKSVLRFDFPARGSMPAVKVFWHDGVPDAPFRPADLPANEVLGDIPDTMVPGPVGKHLVDNPTPMGSMQASTAENFERKPGSGVLFMGDKGYITVGEYGGAPRLLPLAKMADYKVPPAFLTRSPGTYRDWIRACKLGDPAASNFDVAGPFTEWILMGALALRFDGKLDWDSERMRIANNSAANEFLRPYMRGGWKIDWKV